MACVRGVGHSTRRLEREVGARHRESPFSVGSCQALNRQAPSHLATATAAAAAPRTPARAPACLHLLRLARRA
jgi:hypothetical protein